MLMVSDRLRVALVTDHIPVSEVSSSITTDNLRAKVQQFYRFTTGFRVG